MELLEQRIYGFKVTLIRTPYYSQHTDIVAQAVHLIRNGRR